MKSDEKLLDSFLNNVIDIKMDRGRSDMLLSQLLEGKGSKVAPINEKQGKQEKEEEEGDKGGKSRGKRVRSSTGSSSGFRDWQEENKWNLLIQSLTLPRPSTPNILIVGRNNVTLEWHSPYIPGPADTTRFGFNITICKREKGSKGINNGGGLLSDGQEEDTISDENNENRGGGGGGGDKGDSGDDVDGADGCNVWVLERGGAILTEYLDKKKSFSTGLSSSLFSATLLNLIPHTYYSMKMTLFYDTSESIPSEWSPIFMTRLITVPGTIPHPSTPSTDISLQQKAEISLDDKVDKSGKKKKTKTKKSKIIPSVTPGNIIGGFRAQKGDNPNSVCLQYCAPYDDGGDGVLGYQVWVRYDDHKLFHQSWYWWGSYTGSIINKENKGREGQAGLEGYSREIVISNLLANTSYVFKLSAYNTIGNATLSYPSNTITTAHELTDDQMVSSTYARFFLYGRGHPLFGPTRSESGFGVKPVLTVRTLVTLDDSDQSLSIILPVTEHSSENILGGGLIPIGTGTNQESEDSGIRFKVPEFKTIRIDGWISHFSPKMFSVTAECAWVSPRSVFSGERGVRNGGDIQGRIAVVQRGAVPIVMKALAAQHYGAVGLIIVDDGSCTKYDQNCLPGAQKARGEGFARQDVPKPWLNVKIPVMFLLREEAVSFLSAAGLSSVEDGGEAGEGDRDEL